MRTPAGFLLPKISKLQALQKELDEVSQNL
jgi:hypothetical protein